MLTPAQLVPPQFIPVEILPIQLGSNSLGQPYMQYAIYEGDPEDIFDYSDEYTIIDKMKADYALLLVELQTTPTSQNIEYALKGCKHGLTNLEQYVERLKSDVDITNRKVATGFKDEAERTDILEKWDDPDWTFRIDEVVKFYMDLKDFALHLSNYLSELSKHSEKTISQSQLEQIAQYNIEIANRISFMDMLASHLPELSFFLEIANYNLNYYQCTSEILSADLGYFLFRTENIFTRLYQATTPVEYTSFFLVTASRALRMLIEDLSVDRELKDKFCALFVRIDSEIQSYNTRNAEYYHNTNPIFFAELKYLQLTQVVVHLQKNKIRDRYTQARKVADFEKNPILYSYSFYHDNCIFGREVLNLLESTAFKYEDKSKRDEALKGLQKMISPLTIAASFLLCKNEFDSSPIDSPLNSKVCDFIASITTSILLCDTVINRCISDNNDWIKRIAKQRKPASERKSKIDTLYSEINIFLSAMSDIAIEINQLEDEMLRRKLKRNPSGLEMLIVDTLRELKDQLKSFARSSKYDLYDIDNEMLYKPLDADFVDKFITWKRNKCSKKYKDFLDEFKADTNAILANIEKQNAKQPKNTAPAPTTPIKPSDEKQEYSESSTPKHKKRRKKKKTHPPQEINENLVDIDFTPEIGVEAPEVEISPEETMLDEATSLMLQKRWDEGYKTLAEAVNLATTNKNHLIYLRSLHAQIRYKIGHVTYLKNKVITYDQLQTHEIRENAGKVIYGMKCWKAMINSINYLIDQSDSFKTALYNTSKGNDLPKPILDKIKMELSDLEIIIKDNESMLETELDKITNGQQKFHAEHPNMPKKGFGVFGELKSYTRSAMGAFAGLKGALSLSRAQLNKPSHIIVGENIDGDSVNHIKLFLSRCLGPDEQKSSLGILTELYTASASTGNIIVNSAYKDELFKAQICDANGAILESVKAYLRTHLVKTSDSPLSFTYKLYKL